MESTYLMIKPDGIKKGLENEIIKRIELTGLTVDQTKKFTINAELAKKHYGEHEGKPFYPDLIKFITSGPVLGMKVTGENAVKRARDLMGATDPKKALPGTLRADFADSPMHNIIHGSDSLENAKRELQLFFNH
jgi:nucleoside-diphosphate kinase